MKKRFLIPVILLIILLTPLIILFFLYADNTTLQLTTYQISNAEIPAEFNGFRIAQVADLHNAEFGENNTELIAMLSESKPDIIVFTGDQLDARATDFEIVLDLARQAVKIAPCYLVTGNHEGSIPQMSQHLAMLEEIGIIVLDDKMVELSHQGAVIDLIGLHDPTLNKRYDTHDGKECLEMSLQELDIEKDHYTILLAHQPGYLYVYERNGVDLALCGHNHGGQIRIGDHGLISASKKLFPEYDAGVYILDDATMVLSRGLGNSLFPWRVNNPPEIVIVELNSLT